MKAAHIKCVMKSRVEMYISPDDPTEEGGGGSQW
jgi:hypothetical protein